MNRNGVHTVMGDEFTDVFFDIGANILGGGEISIEEETTETKYDGWRLEDTKEAVGQGPKDT